MTKRYIFIHIFILLIFTLGLSACGGGGSDSEPSVPDTAIFVNAGANLRVTEETNVTLTAEARSGDDTFTYTWNSSPSLAITHADTSIADASFTAPTVTQDTQYTLTLVVTNNSGERGEDSLVVTVVPANLAPIAAITAPTFNNVAPSFLPAGVAATFSSELSGDPDAPDSERQIVGWLWQQTAGPDVLGSTDTNQPELVISTVISDTREAIGLSLTVTDAEGATGVSQTTFTVLAQDETPPVAEAGLDQFVFSGETIIMAGTASSSVPLARPVVVEWDSVDTLNINQNTVADTYALAPLVEQATSIVVELSVTDAFGNTASDELLVNVRPPPIYSLNDTGVTRQGTTTSIVDQQQNAFPGQDGQRGQDIMALSNVLEKAGRGRVGFDYTALNENGDEMDDLAQPWQCVRDNTTGLVWEVKTDDAQLHDQDATYSWFLSEDNGGFEGDVNGANTACGLQQCNTEAFITAVNQVGLCGFFDWRLPNHDELMSIVDFGATNGIKADQEYFPNMGNVASGPIWYWTSQPGADGVADDDAQNAWALDFTTGVDNFLNKSSAVRIRLVRAGR